MKSDVKGASRCPVGEERWEEFNARGVKRIQYDYRAQDGELFSGIFKSLEKAKAARDRWLDGRKTILEAKNERD